MALGAVYLTKPLVAYTPPFSYNSASICNYSRLANDNWFKALGSACGSETKVYELIVPSTMVDSNGNLYCITADWFSTYFGGRSYYVIRINPSGRQYVPSYYIAGYIGSNYNWPFNRTPTPSANDVTQKYFIERSWMGLTPCVAREGNGSSDYVYCFMYVLPARWWNDSSGGDTEGLLLWKVRKSDGGITDSKFLPYGTYSEELAMGHFPKWYGNNNKLAFSAYHDVNGGKVYCLWLSSSNDYLKMRTLTFNTSQNTWAGCSTFYHNNADNTEADYRSYSLEPRIIRGTSAIYPLVVRNGYYPYIHILGTDTWYRSFNGTRLHSSYYNCKECSYHTDFAIVKASDNTEVFVVLMFSDVDQLKEMNKTSGGPAHWTTSYVPWGTTQIMLHVQSLVLGKEWVSGPENVIYVTTINRNSASPSWTLSTSTLYKCTHKLVAYNHYIIYAYCYPGKKTHLILGVARYSIDSNDSNKGVYLSTKREFTDQNGDSFGNLTNCSRIVSMEVSANGHLWITWMSADDKTYYYFHANAQDVIDQAI
ncbi:MAG: hypothetical protein LBJ78_01930 [Puniceicoccales bacterium]|jgi:hypothetical protein|nr:hypothetical protein [Puniceicoccales bacterium]